MPTDNPKISLYVPQQIYDRFKSFQEERKLSMSQAGIVILAEYFGIEETIKEITEGTTIGGVTLAEFEELKQRIQKLETKSLLQKDLKVEQNKTTSKPQSKNQSIDKIIESPVQQQNQLKLIEGNSGSISAELLAKRLGSKNPKSVRNKKSEIYKNNNPNADSQFYKWSQKKDFDNIGWKPVKEGIKVNYIPSGELPSDSLSRLQKWMTSNT